jgi:hypothetical protein
VVNRGDVWLTKASAKTFTKFMERSVINYYGCPNFRQTVRLNCSYEWRLGQVMGWLWLLYVDTNSSEINCCEWQMCNLKVTSCGKKSREGRRKIMISKYLADSIKNKVCKVIR